MSNKVEIEAELIHETGGAYQISDGSKYSDKDPDVVMDGKRCVWVPKSLVEYDDDKTFTMPEWLAIDKELV